MTGVIGGIGTIVVLLLLLLAGWVGFERKPAGLPKKCQGPWSTVRRGQGPLELSPELFDLVERIKNHPPPARPVRRRDNRVFKGGESLTDVNARWEQAHPKPSQARAPVVRWGTPLVDSR
jgi:hypothetical protein